MRKNTHLTISDIPLSPEAAHFVIEYCKDTDIHRAAAACGIEPTRAFELRTDKDVNTQIQRVLQSNLGIKDIDADWLMQELYYVHLLALQQGKLSVSLQTLKTLGALGKVDAYAAEKVELKSDRDVIERLMRERKRRLETAQKIVKFDIDDGKPTKPSFI